MKIPIYPNLEVEIREYPAGATPTWTNGAPLVEAAGVVNEVAATPTTVLGFALHAGAVDPDPSIQLVALAKAESTFFGEGDVAPTAANEGISYGLAKDADGDWYVNTADTTNLAVKVIRADTTRNLYEFKVLDAARQLN